MKIVFFGDSITDMFRNRENDNDLLGMGIGFPQFVAATLTQEPNDYVFYNRGISGDKSIDLYARIKKDVWNLDPDILSILVGVNDLWHEIDFQNGIEVPRFKQIYKTIISETLERLPNTKIILCEPFALFDGSSIAPIKDKFLPILDYARSVKDLAKEFNLPFLPLQDVLEEKAKLLGTQNVLIDGVHPTRTGAYIIASEWLKLFNSIK